MPNAIPFIPAMVTLAASASLGSAHAASPRDGDWPVVAEAADGDCALVITGNGQFYRVAATGLGPGASGRYVLQNGDMTPIDWAIRADDQGGFARYYLPFRWHRQGGTVTVTVTRPGCALTAAFPWQRATVAVR